MSDFHALYQLTRRNIKLFFKDKANVFFSLMAPLIVLVLYVLILGKMQVDGLTEALAEYGITGGEAKIKAFCDSWMLAGAISCASITVPLCATGIIIQDKARGITADLTVSPVAKWVTPCSYFLSVMATGLLLGMAVLGICFIWLAASGSWFLSVGDVFGCLGALIVSIFCSATLLVFVVSFFRSQGAFSALNVILGTVIGFLIGAYMPITTFPKPIQTFTLFLPGSYSAGLFRNFMMRGALEEIATGLSPAFAAGLETEFSLTFDFFGLKIGIPLMFVALIVASVIFAGCNLCKAALRRKQK